MTPKNPVNDASFESLLRLALAREGLIIPETEEEVRIFEQNVDLSLIEVPAHLSDPFSALARYEAGHRVEPPELPRKAGTTDETSEMHALAARFGGTISATIKSRMRADRERAEKESGDGDE